jgi:hypothetical protein
MNQKVAAPEEDVFLCVCGGFLKQSHTDDIGTAWFKCSGCGRIESLPNLRKNSRQTLEELKAHQMEMEKPLTVDDLVGVLGSTVKYDDENKAITFLSMLLTYTEDDQTNIGFLAESSTGKSYIPLELSWYFPKEDVMKLGYASPQTFFYEAGELIPDPSDTRDVEDEKRRKIRIVDLHKKILIFMDQPHDQLLQRLRSLLSHDEKEIVSKLVNKREKSGNRTETVIIKGFPTVIFCSAKFTLQDQEKTRLLLLSPEINQEKLKDTVALRIDKEGDREAFYKRMTEDPQRRLVAVRVEDVKKAKIKNVNIPEQYRTVIFNEFTRQHRFLVPRHQRDIGRLLSIIKAHALLNFMHRERIEDSIVANLEDVEAGFKLYSSVSEANEIGLSPELYTVFKKLKPSMDNFEIGITRKDFQKLYFQECHKTIGQKYVISILEAWTNVGLVIEQPDPNDKRFLRYMPPECGTTPEEEVHETQILKAQDLVHTEGAHIDPKSNSESNSRKDDKLERALGHKP